MIRLLATIEHNGTASTYVEVEFQVNEGPPSGRDNRLQYELWNEGHRTRAGYVQQTIESSTHATADAALAALHDALNIRQAGVSKLKKGCTELAFAVELIRQARIDELKLTIATAQLEVSRLS